MGGPHRNIGKRNQETMKNLISVNALQHLGLQLGVGLLLAGVTYLAGADYSALGAWGPVAQGMAAVVLSAVHQATGAKA